MATHHAEHRAGTDDRGVVTGRRHPVRRLAGRLPIYVLLIGLSCVFVLPFVWQVTAAFKSNAQILEPGLNLIPDPFRPENFGKALAAAPFDRWFFNTLFIAVLGTVGATLSSAYCAYGFAILRARGSRYWFGLCLLTILIPFEALLIPEYIVWAKLGWVNTPLPLILPWWLGGGAFNIFLMRQFFKGLPRDLVDAARVDGASEFRIFWQIMLPLTVPALTVVAVFHFIFLWNDFLGPLVYLQDTNATTLPVGLSGFLSRFSRQWSVLMAGSLMALIPVVILFAVAQRYIVRGINLAGVKK
jgi:multiple sugar transport system permease protein